MPPKFANAFFLDKDDAQIVLIRTWIEKGPPPWRRWDKSGRGREVSFSTRDDTSISHFLINRFKPVLTGTGGDKCGTSQKSFILRFVPPSVQLPLHWPHSDGLSCKREFSSRFFPVMLARGESFSFAELVKFEFSPLRSFYAFTSFAVAVFFFPSS